MPLTFANIRTKRKEADINLGTEEEPQILKVVFNPRVYSPAYVNELEALQEAADNSAWGPMLSRLITSWDLVWGEADAADGLCSAEEVGKPYPITKESLSRLPIEVLSLLADGINEASQGAAKKTGTPPDGESIESGSSLAESEGPLFESGDSSTPPVG